MSSENEHVTENKGGLWYTYFGKGGAAVFAFLWVVLLMFWIFGVLKWG